ncbi:MAG: hypothetical protein C0467_33655 [Planctomycetaceae bacterium]|nr:hypothetical protein [Planctomycetaceae bacterium]
MAFEVRKTGGTGYFYLSRRDPTTGKVVKQYVGTGPKADAAAKALAARRQQRVTERLAVERLGAKLRPADALMAELDEAATLVMEAALLAAGFHRVNYSRWRKRRATDGHGGHREATNNGHAG